MNASPTIDGVDGLGREPGMRDSLSQFCFPQSSHDPMRKVVWTNALCLCVLAGGLIGIERVKQLPVFAAKPLPPVPVVAEVIKPNTPPPVQQVSEVKEMDPNDPPPILSAPTPVVAVLMSVDIPFAVEVKGVQRITAIASEATLIPRTVAAAKADAPVMVQQPVTRERIQLGDNSRGNFPKLTEYPPEAQRLNLEGRVSIEYSIEPDGRISEIRVGSSSGHKILDDYAMNWVRKQFKPNPSPEKHLAQTAFLFRLK